MEPKLTDVITVDQCTNAWVDTFMLLNPGATVMIDGISWNKVVCYQGPKGEDRRLMVIRRGPTS